MKSARRLFPLRHGDANTNSDNGSGLHRLRSNSDDPLESVAVGRVAGQDAIHDTQLGAVACDSYAPAEGTRARCTYRLVARHHNLIQGQTVRAPAVDPRRPHLLGPA